MLKILSIDIGIINLGYVYAEVGDKLNVLECNRVDITNMRHKLISHCDCKLHHDNCMPDYIDHFIQEHTFFENCDLILIERQPPVGITNVQDLIFSKFRNKVKLVSPNTIHKFFKMTKGNYDLRKNESLNLSYEFLNDFKSYQFHERKHDMSDAMLILIHYFKNQIKPKIPKIKVLIDFEEFRFKPV